MPSIRARLYEDVEQAQLGLADLVQGPTDALVLLSLGVAPSALVPLATSVGAPVLLAECYGILGPSAAQGRNLELMEAGRGREYGGAGGDGGKGVVAVCFGGDGLFVPSTEDLPAGATSHMVIAGSGAASFLAEHGSAVYYGGLAKATYRFDASQGRFVAAAQICVSTRLDRRYTVGTTSFTGDAAAALQELLGQLPAGAEVEGVALFPCFMRGKNMYSKNNVEPDAVAEVLPHVPLFGMFCHGELGPKRCMGFDPADPSPGRSCGQHSMTTIVAVLAARP